MHAVSGRTLLQIDVRLAKGESCLVAECSADEEQGGTYACQFEKKSAGPGGALRRRNAHGVLEGQGDPDLGGKG